MSFSVNKAILLGNLTKDPELRYTKAGKPVLTINIATNHSVKRDDNWEDIPTFHRVVVWGKIAEWLSNNVKKGTKVYVDGRIHTREYEDKNGNKQRSREIIADNVIPMSQGQARAVVAQEEQGNTGSEKMDESVSPDDIPF